MNEIGFRIMKICMTLIFLFSMVFVAKETAEYVGSGKVVEGQKCVIIDPGHGGNDPGKVGINGALEKDVNLEIAKKLAKLLEANDIQVIMTRETDEGLYDESSKSKKVQDLKNRIALIEKYKPAMTISIHQNSYGQEYVKGAQVFYYTNSEEGKKQAEILQECFRTYVDSGNNRQAKANDSYYMLKKTGYPIVIAECGFLSNYEEADLLTTEEYQQKIAWAIHFGVLQYLND